jgi:hypothetical protein
MEISKGQDRKSVGEIIAEILELGSTFREGAKPFSVQRWMLYHYNKKSEHEAREPAASMATTPSSARLRAKAPRGLPGDIGGMICTSRRSVRLTDSSGFRIF